MDRLFGILVYHLERIGLDDGATEEIRDALLEANAEVRTLRQQVWELKQVQQSDR